MPQQGDTNEGSLLLDRCNLGDQRLRAVAALNYEQAGIGTEGTLRIRCRSWSALRRRRENPAVREFLLGPLSKA